MKKRIFCLLTALLFLLSLLAFVGCDTGDDGTQSSAGEEGGGSWRNYSGLTVQSGDMTVSPFSGVLSMYEEQRMEDGEIVAMQGCGEGTYEILKDPIGTFPRLIRSGDVSVTLPANGMISEVYLVDMEDPDKARTTTTLDGLSLLPAGEYCVVLRVLLSVNGDADTLVREYVYEDVFCLVVRD